MAEPRLESTLQHSKALTLKHQTILSPHFQGSQDYAHLWILKVKAEIAGKHFSHEIVLLIYNYFHFVVDTLRNRTFSCITIGRYRVLLISSPESQESIFSYEWNIMKQYTISSPRRPVKHTTYRILLYFFLL